MTTNPLKECPTCGIKLGKKGFFSADQDYNIMSESDLQLIKDFNPEAKPKIYCQCCGSELLAKARQLLHDYESKIVERIKNNLSCIPVISTHSPINWDYEVIGMVTGQSTTGTGVISELTSSFTDFFGAQSGAYNKKLKVGEDLCFSQLRKQAIDLGANAVLATDIDYSEVGGRIGMLMVCMAGTAVKLKNLDIVGSERAILIDEVVKLNNHMNYLMKKYHV